MITGEHRSTREEPDLGPCVTPQIPHRLIWDRTLAIAVRTRRMTSDSWQWTQTLKCFCYLNSQIMLGRGKKLFTFFRAIPTSYKPELLQFMANSAAIVFSLKFSSQKSRSVYKR